MFRRTTLLVALAAVLVPMAAWAQAPAYMPVQGFLTDSDGVPVDGDTTLTFSLYVGDLDDTPVYSEEQQVLVEDGFFTVYLGQVVTLDLVLFKDSAPMYLGMAVGEDAEMAPRLALGSVPYAGFAQHAGDAQTLGGMSAEDFRASGDGVAWEDLTDVPAGLEDGDADALGGLSCTEGQVAKYDATAVAWVCGDDLDTFLTETEVDAMVDNNGYALAADLASVAFSGSFTDLSDVPTDQDTLAGLGCADGQLPKWDGASTAWVCAEDIDTGFTTETELTALLDDNYLSSSYLPDWTNLQNIPGDIADGDDGFTTEAELTTLLDDNYLPSTYLPDWTSLQNVPVGFADGVDNDTVYSATSPITLDPSNSFGLGTDAVTADHIAPDAVGASELADNSVASANIIDGSVSAIDLQDGAALAEIADDDGSGSGLDADLLDGNHASAFAPVATQAGIDYAVSGTWAVSASTTIRHTFTMTAPTNGYVACSFDARVYCSNGQYYYVSWKRNGGSASQLGGGWFTYSTYSNPVSVSMVYQVTGGTTYNFTLEDRGTCDGNLVESASYCLFVPRAL